jgi:predicted site-specific integrase-resolvase
MKASEVKNVLRVTQKTINNYIKQGKLHPYALSKTHYEYDDDEVYALIGKGKKERKTVTYSRVSLRKQKNDLESQQQRIYNWAVNNGYKVDMQLKDIKSGMSFAERKDFQKLISLAATGHLETVIVENRDRLSRFGFEMIESMFEKLGVKIIVISNVDDKSYEKELTDDLISIIHYYSMKSYSMRSKLHKAELVLSSSDEDEIEN